MGRYSYDDMPPEGYRERRESSKRGTFVIAFVGILLTLIAIIVYLMYTPRNAEAAAYEEESTVMTEPIPAETAAVEEEPEAAVPAEPSVPSPIVSSVQPLSIAEYTVSDDDTLQSIAEKFGITAATVKEFNAIDGVKAVPGTVIRVPEYSGTLYTVREGDTLSSIVQSYNPELSANDLAAVNGLDTTEIKAGDEIFIPAFGSDITRDNSFASPVEDGKVIRHRGEYYMDKNETVEGVVIAATPGTAVLSASDGTVRRVGMTAERRRYIEIESADEYTAFYMDIENPLVKSGDTVEQGSVIGMIGSSSKYYGEPAILFSISQGGISIDPEDMIVF